MISKYKFIDKAFIVLLALYPVALIFGNSLINIFIFLFSISFLVNYRENKSVFREKNFYFILFFLFSLLINSFLSTNPSNSFPRAIKIVLIIFFIFEIKRLVKINDLNTTKYIYLSWFVIFFGLTVDIIFELIFGFNSIGNKSYIPGRITSFFGDELVVGAYYHGFVLFFLSYLIFRKSNIYILIASIFIVLSVSFLIGERSNFIKVFLSLIIFSSFALNINYKIKISVILTFLILIFLFMNINKNYKLRYFNQIKTIFSYDGYSNYIKKSLYGAHRNAAIKMFKENPYFGVGIKNFRNEAGNKKYENKEYSETDIRGSTHPHQVHHEFLSETGIFGYLSFLLFIFFSLLIALRSYLKTKNIFQLSGIIFVFTSLLPILPSGSFLSTFSSGIFWLNFAIMNSYISKSKF